MYKITFTISAPFFPQNASPSKCPSIAGWSKSSTSPPNCNLEGEAIIGESKHTLSSATPPGVRGVRPPALALMLPVDAPLLLEDSYAQVSNSKRHSQGAFNLCLFAVKPWRRKARCESTPAEANLRSAMYNNPKKQVNHTSSGSGNHALSVGCKHGVGDLKWVNTDFICMRSARNRLLTSVSTDSPRATRSWTTKTNASHNKQRAEQQEAK